jgi:hypothetical protein
MNAIQSANVKHKKCVFELIRYDVNVNVVSRKTGKTHLHVAIESSQMHGYEHLIRYIVKAGADNRKEEPQADRPILKFFYGVHMGSLEEHRHKDLALLLSEDYTGVNSILLGTLSTPLHLAVRRKDPYNVVIWLYKNAIVNTRTASSLISLLLVASQFQIPWMKE